MPLPAGDHSRVSQITNRRIQGARIDLHEEPAPASPPDPEAERKPTALSGGDRELLNLGAVKPTRKWGHSDGQPAPPGTRNAGQLGITRAPGAEHLRSG